MRKLSIVETNILLDLIYKHKGIMESNDSNRSDTQPDNQLAWKLIVKEFNSKVEPNNQASNLDLQLKYLKLKTQINSDEESKRMPTSVRDRLVSIMSKPEENDGVKDVPTSSKEPTTVLGEPMDTVPKIFKLLQNPVDEPKPTTNVLGHAIVSHTQEPQLVSKVLFQLPEEPDTNKNPKNVKRTEEQNRKKFACKMYRIRLNNKARRKKHGQILNDLKLNWSKFNVNVIEENMRCNKKINELSTQVLQLNRKVTQLAFEMKKSKMQNCKDVHIHVHA